MGSPTFILPSHKEWYSQLLKEDGTHPDDNERKALFFVISGNRDLYRKRSNHPFITLRNTISWTVCQAGKRIFRLDVKP